jgi:hypothetical protein
MVRPAPPAALAVEPVAVPLTTVPVGAVATLHEVRDAESRQVLRTPAC